MSKTPVQPHTEFSLPLSVVSKVDVARLLSELEQVDDAMTTAAVRAKAGGRAPASPALSEQLSDFIEENSLELSGSAERTRIIKQLRLLKQKAPLVHMTFAAPADHESLRTIAKWLRESVHPQAVIAVGLQPGLVGGVYVRTPNHVHDFSMRAQLQSKRDVLIGGLEALRAGK